MSYMLPIHNEKNVDKSYFFISGASQNFAYEFFEKQASQTFWKPAALVQKGLMLKLLKIISILWDYPIKCTFAYKMHQASRIHQLKQNINIYYSE